MHALAQEAPALPGTAPLRAWARPFLLAFTGLTLLMLGNQVWRRFGQLASDRFALDQAVKVVLLCLPFIVAMTLPAAVLLSAAYVFSRPGVRLSPARSLAGQLAPTLLVALGLSLAAWVLVDQVLPRTNFELRRVLIALSRRTPEAAPADASKGDREMTTAEMSAVVRDAEVQLVQATASGDLEASTAAADRVAQYRVEIQKKGAIAAACLVFALAGAGVGMQLRGRRWWLPLGAGVALFGLYYVGLVLGESLANQRQLSPVLAMWGGNLLFALLGALLLLRQGGAASVRQAPA
ncbi:MAG: LptF/LptG family permease [Gemmatimonadales bacterium]